MPHELFRFGENLLGLHDREHRLPGLSITRPTPRQTRLIAGHRASVMPSHGHIIVQDDGETLKRQIQDDLFEKSTRYSQASGRSDVMFLQIFM